MANWVLLLASHRETDTIGRANPTVEELIIIIIDICMAQYNKIY